MQGLASTATVCVHPRCLPIHSLSCVGGFPGPGVFCVCPHALDVNVLHASLHVSACMRMCIIRFLAQIMADHKDEEIDFLKMDIEGHEWAVLEELLSQTNSPLFKVDQLCLEIHFDVNDGTHSIESSEIAALKTLARRFEMFWRDDNFRFCSRHLWLPGARGHSIRKCHNICYLRRPSLSS